MVLPAVSLQLAYKPPATTDINRPFQTCTERCDGIGRRQSRSVNVGSLDFHEVVMVIRVRDFRSVKPKAECCIGLKKLRHALAEDRSNQDIGIQNDHLSERQPFGASA